MLKRFLAFLSLGNLWYPPAGTIADNSTLFGLFGFAQNANSAAPSLSTPITTAVPTAVPVAALISGIVMLAAGAGGGFLLNLPSTTAILAALGPTVVPGNFAMQVSFLNNGVGQTGTVTAGDANTTVTGTATVATNTRRTFMLTVNANSTITFQNMGTLAL